MASKLCKTDYDVVVVGAGVEGSATAYQLRRRGVRVLLLEQFRLPHSRGSSHGQSRITRKTYAQPYYTRMMEYCTHHWNALQRAVGYTVFEKFGFMAIGDLQGETMRKSRESMEHNGAEHEYLSTKQLRTRYPNLTFEEGWGGLYDPNGGILLADKAVQAFQKLFVEMGGHIRDGEPVVGVDPGTTIRVTTAPGNTFSCNSLVLCCGPWTNKMLKPLQLELPLKPLQISVCYWPEKVPGTYGVDKLPCFFEISKEENRNIYGLPSFEYPGHVKMCLHRGPDIDPDHRDEKDGKWAVDIAADYVRKHFPGLHPKPSIVEKCIYTMTPDEDLILDTHPKWNNIVIGAGFSGHGFKLAPAVGQILTDLALQLPPQHDISYFRIDRFPQGRDLKAKL